ncbi:MAG: phosphatase PAP2 family protein [Blastomonas sp.]
MRDSAGMLSLIAHRAFAAFLSGHGKRPEGAKDDYPASIGAQDWPVWPWQLIGLLALIDGAFLALGRAELTGSSWLYVMGSAGVAGLAMLGSGWLRSHALLCTLFRGIAFSALAWPVLRIFNYLSMTIPFPMTDALLAQWDAALGFDWLGYLQWLNQYPPLLLLMDMTYTGLEKYAAAFFVLIALFPDSRHRCFELIALFVSTAILSMVIGIFFPALAPMGYYAPDVSGLRMIDAGIGIYHIDNLAALREQASPLLNLSDMPGLVTFPSFHTAMGVVLIYVCRGNRTLFGISLVINLLMIAATPLFGSHYLVDLIGGVAVALFAIAALRRAERSHYAEVRPQGRLLVAATERPVDSAAGP